jgi:hypothetical protein
MKIINLKNDIYQVINLPDNSVLFQGTYDKCLAFYYKMFMSIGEF